MAGMLAAGRGEGRESSTAVPAESKQLAEPWIGSWTLPIDPGRPVLAVGAESKGAFCVASGGVARLSHAYGSLLDADAYRRYHADLSRAVVAFGADDLAIACDLHPQYLSTQSARNLGGSVHPVQHHHAHVAACMVEHGLTVPVIGVCCDGAGLGDDGASWGCEVLAVTPQSCRRLAHLGYFGLPGSDRAAAECWRPAFALAKRVYPTTWPGDVAGLFDGVPVRDLRIVEQLLVRGWQCPRTSSLGRLFDAVAFLLGICQRNGREAEAAQALQRAAEQGGAGRVLPVDRHETAGLVQWDIAPTIGALIAGRWGGAAVTRLAADFHETIAALLADEALAAARRAGLNKVVLTGGCLLNQLLASRLQERLTAGGVEVLEHVRASCGDGGLALGQAYIVAARLADAQRQE
jgi:hydrogenase maturation protein HypF